MSYSANAQAHLFSFTSSRLGWWIQITWQGKSSKWLSMMSQSRREQSDTDDEKKKKNIEACFQKLRSFVNTFGRAHRGQTLKRMKSRVVGDTSVIKPYDVKYARCLSEKKEKFCPLCGFHFKEITRFKCNKQVFDILQTFTHHLVWVSEALHNYHTKKTTLNVHRTCTHV